MAVLLLPPDQLRQPGFGDWSPSVNGYSRFLEVAIRQCKEAALRCAENHMQAECQIFLERVLELEEKLLLENQKTTNKKTQGI